MAFGFGFSVSRVIRAGGSPFDPDALAYITTVEAADGQALEAGVRTAINEFVVGCKADGIWAAIKASCILAGARTLTGALVPLVGSAPTNFNFVSGDYNRRTGLIGDGTTKYLDSNRNVNADPQNSNHQAVFITQAESTRIGFYIGGRDAGAGSNRAVAYNRISSSTNPADPAVDLRNNTAFIGRQAQTSSLGLWANSRNNASNFQGYWDKQSTTLTAASLTPIASGISVFGVNTLGTIDNFTNARLSFYSIGESLNLAQLDTRTTALMAALAFGINTGLPASDYDADTVAYVNRGYAAGGSLS
jgi:hypothetical protein